MKTFESKLICCPRCKTGLQFTNRNKRQANIGEWHCSQCGSTYVRNNGFIQFISEDDVFRFNKKMEMWRAFYASFYTPFTNLMFLPCGGAHKARREVLENLEIHPGSQILETGIGTGDNIYFLRNCLSGCIYYGLDNQVRMLEKCKHNSLRWKKEAVLYLANAEELPFKDNSFDVVYQFGAFNLFQDKRHALEEMIRVARPGTKIVIADETEKATRLFAIFTGHQEPSDPPIHLVPREMEEVYLKTIWNGYGYLVSFRKPG
jgi:ubiquinone/menaquinone biosynthesis C-methylase UbiE